MDRSNYQFLLDVYQGKIKRKLTDEELKELKDNEFVMSFLISTPVLLKYCGGYEMIKKIVNLDGLALSNYMEWLSKIFNVDPELILIKMASIVYEREKEKNKRAKIKKKNHDKQV